jgi:mannose-6-phosphate isomerase-like protein (cupin superfamily)
MNTRSFLLAAMLVPIAGSSQMTAPRPPLAQRIGHTDLDKVELAHSHGSVGLRKCQTLVPASAMDVNLNFVFRCQMQPGGGVAEHYHNTVEEMFTILDGEAEFTVDSHTSRVKGPAGAPQHRGHSHAIYNPTNQPVDYLNINVSMTKGHYDAFNLGDSRDKVANKDDIPQFMLMRLDRTLLQPIASYRGGQGTVQYRRALDSDVFETNWAYVDHLLIPPSASEGMHYHTGVEEIYYVMDGAGQVQVNGESEPIHKGDGIPILFREPHSFINNGTSDLELMIIGISAVKDAVDTELGTPHRPGL